MSFGVAPEAVMDLQETTTVLTGRDDERRVLRDLVATTAQGRGGALLVYGAAGVGKSALLHSAVSDAQSRGFTVLHVAGLEPERWYPFAALHRLLRPVLPLTVMLPDAHRETLDATFGDSGSDHDVYRVGLAVLELLTEAAEQRPLLVTADDVQWIDSSSRDALAFAARRAGGHALLVLGSARTDDAHRFNWGMRPAVRLGPLSPEAAGKLLDATTPGLARPARQLILDHSGGNPLALVELPKVVRSGAGRTGALPVTRRLEDAFADRADAVSPGCRAVLLALSAEPAATLDRILVVASALTGTPVTVDVLQEAIDARLMRLAGGNPEFRHPLIRSAVYHRAPIGERRVVHRILAAQMLDSPERSLTHEAAAATGVDVALATRLEQFADAALARGRVAAAVPALCRAAGLTGDGGRRTGLLVRAAELSAELSDRHLTRSLLADADLSLAEPVDQARLLIVRDSAAFEPDEPTRRISRMVTAAAAAFDTGSRVIAENLLWRAGARCFFQDGDDRVRAETSTQLDRWGGDPADPMALAVRAYARPYDHGKQIVEGLVNAAPDWRDGRTLHYLGTAAMVVGASTHAARYLGPAAAVWRAEGRLGLLTRALAGSWPMVYLGRLDQARADAEEGVALAEETGEKIAWLGLKATAALVAVLRGETETAGRAAAELRAAPLFPGMRFAMVMAQQVDGLRALFAGEAETAYRLLAQAFDPADEHYHSVSRWLLAPDLADAAIAAGTADQARHLIAGLPLLARRLPSEMMTVAAAYTGAVLGAGTESEARYVEALAALPAGWPLARARLHLHHGRWLRRHRRDVEARKPLRAARDEFERIGAWAWAAAARESLRAAGEASGGPHSTPAAQLSAQELRIVVLASQGLTNREIGQRLFLSHRTVGSQLYRIYPRLGVSSRRDLAAALNGLR